MKSFIRVHVRDEQNWCFVSCTLDYYSASTVSFEVPFYAGVNVVACIETLLNVVYDCYQ